MTVLNYDDIPEAKPAGTPIEPDPKPPKTYKRRRIIRTKAISAMWLVENPLLKPGQWKLADNLCFKRHHRRPFVMWLAEVEP